ncbi:Seed imbibition 1 isoform 1 [Hibiscus syriacus]|uniref:Seed imbibition 1 isoform 1 n=1 Tax=Hibiscus syriacus TaxID=106335 RepID=A0A6A3C8Y3_HIBSY|nr:Seed imbibition 1 isoform 1 [Hibiscus syriacus]
MALSLSNNSLDGTVPECIGNLSSLSHVDLRMNNFYGKIPENFAEGCRLKSFLICKNQVEGSLPRSLGNCKDLKLLDVGNNYLNDTFPNWLGNLDQLQVLVLRSNRFYGEVDSYDVTFTRLRVIDLSRNNFSGYLHVNFFENLHAIREVNEKKVKPEYMEEVIVGGTVYSVPGLSFTTKGLETEFEKLLTIWTDIDFSRNQFSGEIPKTIGELHSLIALNLSHNCLTGPIPSSLGDLSELESLDLSSNKLHGKIPTEFTNLGFLEVLNLSHNNLVGPIPKGKQLDTFSNDSYVGNLGLCGLPLSKSCDNDEGTAAKFDRDDDDDDDDDGLNWKFSILMGYGCGLVLGLSMGYIVFITGKPWWFIKIYVRVQQRFVEKVKK